MSQTCSHNAQYTCTGREGRDSRPVYLGKYAGMSENMCRQILPVVGSRPGLAESCVSCHATPREHRNCLEGKP